MHKTSRVKQRTAFKSLMAIAIVLYIFTFGFGFAMISGFSENTSVEELELYESRASSRDLLASAEEVKQQAEEEAAKAMAQFKARIPRYNIHFQKVNKTFNPTNLDYLQSIGMMAVPGILLCILSICCGLCFCVWRCLCGLCGGRKPKEGGYNLRERYIPKQILIGIGLIILAAVIFGWIGNTQFTKGTENFFTTVLNTTDDLSSKINYVVNTLSAIPGINPADVQSGVGSLQDGLDQFKEIATTAQEYAKRVNKYREGTITVTFVIAGIASLLALIGAILNRGIPLKIMVAVAFISLFFLWLCFGIHLPLSVILADFCLALDSYLQDASSSLGSNGGDGLSSILTCLTNDSYNPTFSITFAGMDDALNELNSYTVSCCNIYFTLDNVTDIDVNSFPPNYQPQIQAQLALYGTYLDLIDELQGIANCTYVRNAWEKIKYAVCVEMLQALDIIMGCQGIIGTVLFPGVYFAVVGWKRLPNPKKKQRRASDPGQPNDLYGGQYTGEYTGEQTGVQLSDITVGHGNETPPPYPYNPNEVPPPYPANNPSAPPATIVRRD